MSFIRFTPHDVAMLLIDHQVGTTSWVHSSDIDEMKANAVMLARTAGLYGIPVVLTSSMEEYAQGPLMPELAGALPTAFSQRIKRSGIVNAMDDEHFAAAVTATNRKKLIIAGVTNDVCTVYPTLSLLDKGYEIQVVADAGGSPSKMADDIALRRMERAGATITSSNQMLAELVGNWTTPEGSQAVKLLMAKLTTQHAR